MQGAGVGELFKHGVEVGLGDLRLAEPAVKADLQLGQIGPDVVEHPLQGELVQRLPALGQQRLGLDDERIEGGLVLLGNCRRGGLALERIGEGLPGALGDLKDVIALVDLLGVGDVGAALLQVAQPDAEGEDLHLPAGVVDVVLALDAVPRRLEHPHEGVAVGRPPPVPDVQRAGRVGRDKLDLNPLGALLHAAAVALPLHQHLADHPVLDALLQVQVDEAAAGDLGALEPVWGVGVEGLGDAAAEAAGIGAQGLGGDQGEVGRVIPVLGVFGAADLQPLKLPGQRLGQRSVGAAQTVEKAVELFAELL